MSQNDFFRQQQQQQQQQQRQRSQEQFQRFTDNSRRVAQQQHAEFLARERRTQEEARRKKDARVKTRPKRSKRERLALETTEPLDAVAETPSSDPLELAAGSGSPLLPGIAVLGVLLALAVGGWLMLGDSEPSGAKASGPLEAPEAQGAPGVSNVGSSAGGEQPAAGTVAVPDLIGKDVAGARAALSEAGLELEGVTEKESEAPAGSVIQTIPRAGFTVVPGSEVAVVVSSGPGETSEVMVEDFIDWTYAEAVETLEELGFDASFAPEEAKDDWIVVEQDPAGGETAPKGSKVTLTLAPPSEGDEG